MGVHHVVHTKPDETNPFSRVVNQNRKFADVSCYGEGQTVRVPGSDVSLHIPEGSWGRYRIHVSTDFSKYLQDIPANECIVGPLVEVVHLNDETHPSNRLHTISIPHNIPNKADWHLMKVRTGKAKDPIEFRDITKKRQEDEESEGFWVDEKLIRIHTHSFSPFVCTICKTVCSKSIKVYLYGNAKALEQPDETQVNIKVFLTSYLYQLPEFREVSFLLRYL